MRQKNQCTCGNITIIIVLVHTTTKSTSYYVSNIVDEVCMMRSTVVSSMSTKTDNYIHFFQSRLTDWIMIQYLHYLR
jgi:hypothetical protein